MAGLRCYFAVSVIDCWWWAGRSLDWYLTWRREAFVPGRCAHHWLSPPLFFSSHFFCPSPSHHARFPSPLPPGSTFPPSPRYSELSELPPSYASKLPSWSSQGNRNLRCSRCPSTRLNITSETTPTRRPPPVPCPIPAANGRRAPLDPISPSAIAPAGDETALGAASGFPRELVGRQLYYLYSLYPLWYQ